ncbi:MAG: ABC transporter permease [Methanomicrobiales archaeon]|nr:ABC transporter permease [Methanomicrobiales archaeon]
MADSGVLIIAKKEFFDIVQSRKFLLILGILLIVAFVAILNGVAEYQAKQNEYNQIQQYLPPAGPDDSTSLTFLRLKPSVLLVFHQMSMLVGVIGGFLGIAMGFDLVTKEKESRSLKLLLSHPVYRDEVINGKAAGGFAAVSLALAVVLAISLSVLLLNSIVPDSTELVILLLFSIVTLLYMFTCFSFSLLMSTLCSESGTSLIGSLLVFIVLGSLIPAIIVSPVVMQKIIGDQPEMPAVIINQMMGLAELPENQVPLQNETEIRMMNRDVWDSYNQKVRDYGGRQLQYRDLQYYISPTKNYEKIATCLTNPTWIRYMLYMTIGNSMVQKIDNQGRRLYVSIDYNPKIDFDFQGILTLIVSNILMLFILPWIFFGLAYVRFMRMDIR